MAVICGISLATTMAQGGCFVALDTAETLRQAWVVTLVSLVFIILMLHLSIALRVLREAMAAVARQLHFPCVRTVITAQTNVQFLPGE